MPTYTFSNKHTGEQVSTEIMSISEMEAKLAANPNLDVIGGATPQADPWRIGRKKPDDGFREVVGKMKNFYKDGFKDTY